ncbi:MAG TPA: trypsin-like peptidase domain-containing protein [Gammaproteobacteria bacterium]|nr:trypsin-like peptidase domain-containing protein [Gammaproteobacteria bacterium]
MAPHGKPIAFAAQSATVGLALAFIAVLVKPELANLERIGTGGGGGYAAAVAASSPAVANIYTERTLTAPRVAPGRVFRDGMLGSGVVIGPEGYVVTNWHVIKGADRIRVQLADGRIAIPKIVGTDPETELALLRIDLDDLPTIKLGRSDSLRVGDVVLAIGNSLGLSQTVTMGIVSATGRGQLGLTTFEDFIQTDAAINMGNSGGALVNTRGELVGINTAVVGSSLAGQDPPEGIGFAIPVNMVRGVMAELIKHGRVIRGYLGVETEDMPAAYAAQLGIDDGPAVWLKTVQGPAAAAGLKAGDVMTHINGQRVMSQQQAMNLVASAKPGDHIRIRVVRPGAAPLETEAVLEERRLQ